MVEREINKNFSNVPFIFINDDMAGFYYYYW